MKHYKKLIVSLVGTVLIAFAVFFDVRLPFTPEGIYEFLVALFTSFGVERISN